MTIWVGILRQGCRQYLLLSIFRVRRVPYSRDRKVPFSLDWTALFLDLNPHARQVFRDRPDT